MLSQPSRSFGLRCESALSIRPGTAASRSGPAARPNSVRPLSVNKSLWAREKAAGGCELPALCSKSTNAWSQIAGGSGLAPGLASCGRVTSCGRVSTSCGRVSSPGHVGGGHHGVAGSGDPATTGKATTGEGDPATTGDGETGARPSHGNALGTLRVDVGADRRDRQSDRGVGDGDPGRAATSWIMAPASVELTLPCRETSPMMTGSRLGKAAKPGSVWATGLGTPPAAVEMSTASWRVNGPPVSVTSPKYATSCTPSWLVTAIGPPVPLSCSLLKCSSCLLP